MAREATILILLLAWSYTHTRLAYADSYSGSRSGEYSPGSAIGPTAPSTSPHCSINYFSAFPCTDLDFEEATSEREALQILRTCDVFAFVAAELAVRHVNQHRLGIFTYPSAGNTVHLVADRGTKSDLAYVTYRFEQILRNIDNYTLHGVIGPQDSEIAISLASVAMRYQITMMTYGAMSPQLSDRQRFPYLHRTTPTTTLLNLGRLRLLREFNWQRCTLLSSPGFLHTESVRELINLAMERRSAKFTADLKYYDTFDETAVHILDEAVKEEIRIFMIFSDEARTRNVLCEAHRYRKGRLAGLTGPAYVWILPSFYDPQWWQLSDNQISRLRRSQRCSNYEMEEIFNMTHLLSAGIYNYQFESSNLKSYQPVNITNKSFLKMVRNLTLHYIPFLADTDLLPYLTHSRAGSAYDAVWAMSRAWHTLTPTLFSSYNTCSILNVTEWQSITGEALNETLNGTFKWVDGEMSYDPSYFQGISGRHNFSKDVNSFGKVLISQYIDGKERPVGIYAASPKGDYVHVENKRSSSGSYDSTHKQSDQIKLGDLIYITKSTEKWLFEAPHDFLWLAGNVPLDAVEMGYSEVPSAAILVVLLAVLLSVVFAAGIGITSLVLRNNKHIKASSSRLSYLVLLGLVLMMPLSLQLALVNSSHSAADNSFTDSALSSLCKAGYFVSSTGQTLAFAVLLVKNWRIYRIFYNSTLKSEMPRYLSDKYLLLIAILLLLPHLLIHVLWVTINPLQYVETTYTLSPTSSLTVTYCSSDNLIAWEFISISYFGALSLVLLFVSLQNNRVPTHFSEEGNQSSIAVLITLAVFVPSLMLLPCLDSDPRLYLHKFWLTALVSVSLPDVLLGTLFLKKFVLIWREWRQQRSQQKERRETDSRQVQLADLGKKASRLKLELMEKENQLLKLQQKHLKDRSGSATSTTSATSATSTTELLPTSTKAEDTDSLHFTKTENRLHILQQKDRSDSAASATSTTELLPTLTSSAKAEDADSLHFTKTENRLHNLQQKDCSDSTVLATSTTELHVLPTPTLSIYQDRRHRC